MNIGIIFIVGILCSCGVFLMLRRSAVRVLLGMMVLSNGINLAIFAAAGVTPAVPPIIPMNEKTLSPLAAEPLSQALILTAIVIGFGLFSYMMALLIRTCEARETDDLDTMTEELQ